MDNEGVNEEYKPGILGLWVWTYPLLLDLGQITSSLSLNCILYKIKTIMSTSLSLTELL